MAERYSKKIYVDIDLNKNTLSNAAIESVVEPPKDAVEGQMVMYQGAPHFFSKGKWEKVAGEGTVGAYQPLDEKDTANGYAGLDGEAKVPTTSLHVGTAWGAVPSDEVIPSEKLVKGELDKKFDADKVTDLSNPTDNTVPTTLAVSQAIANVDFGDKIITKWKDATESNVPNSMMVNNALNSKLPSNAVESGSLSDLADKVPSSKLMIAELDKKLSVCDLDDSLTDNTEKAPTSKAVKDALAAHKSVTIDTDFSAPSDEKVPSSKLVNDSLARKTDVTMAIPEWDINETYQRGSVVFRIYTPPETGTSQRGPAYCLYISKDENTGVDPSISGNDIHWAKVQGNGSSGGLTPDKFKEEITDQTVPFSGESVYKFQHDFNSPDFFWSLRDGQGNYIVADVKAEGLNHVIVSLSKKPAPGESVFVLLRSFGEYESNPPTPTFAESEGTPIPVPEQRWVKENKTARPMYVKTFNSDGEEVRGQVSQNDLTNVSVDFGQKETGEMVTSEVDESRMVKFENKTEVTVQHNLGRFVGVEIFSPDGQEMRGDIVQAKDRMSVTVYFNQPASGTIVTV